jgi:hypothetical protein
MNLEAKPQLEQPLQQEQIRAALNKNWHAPAAGDANAGLLKTVGVDFEQVLRRPIETARLTRHVDLLPSCP